jgi:DNA-binding LytR/AlgR family response regulator
VARVLADTFLAAPHRPFLLALGEDMVADGPLVAFCIAGFIALAHAVRSKAPVAAVPSEGDASGTAPYLATIVVRERGRVTLVDVARIDWIETQGNYLTLHAGAETHLIRETLARLAPRLDPSRFQRVHRRTVVATDRIARIDSLGAGDARLTLKDGTELRLSRTYRASRSPPSATDSVETQFEQPIAV